MVVTDWSKVSVLEANEFHWPYWSGIFPLLAKTAKKKQDNDGKMSKNSGRHKKSRAACVVTTQWFVLRCTPGQNSPDFWTFPLRNPRKKQSTVCEKWKNPMRILSYVFWSVGDEIVTIKLNDYGYEELNEGVSDPSFSDKKPSSLFQSKKFFKVNVSPLQFKVEIPRFIF